MNANLDTLRAQMADRRFLRGTFNRRRAVAELGRIGSFEAARILAVALHDPDKKVRRLAREAIAQLKDPEAVDEFCAIALRREEAEPLELAVAAGHRPRDFHLRLLFEAVSGTYDQDNETCGAAELQAMGDAFDRLDPLQQRHVRALLATEGKGRFARLLRFGRDGAIPKERWSHDRKQAMLDAATIDGNWPEVFSMLEVASFPQILHICQALDRAGWLPNSARDAEFLAAVRQALPVIRELEQQKPPELDDPAADLAAFLRDPALTSLPGPELRQALDHADPGRRAAALFLLRERGADGLEPVSHQQLADPHWLPALAALMCLAPGQEITDYEPFIALLTHQSLWVRLTAAHRIIELLPSHGIQNMAPLERFIARLQTMSGSEGAAFAHRVADLLLFMLQRNAHDFDIVTDLDQGFDFGDIGIEE